MVSQGQGAAEGIGQRVRLESGNPVQDAENPRYREKEEILMEWLYPASHTLLAQSVVQFPLALLLD